MTIINLRDLEKNHPLRNSPLSAIGAQNRWVGGGSWKTVLPHWVISQNTYNDLGPAWTDYTDWRVVK